MSGRMRAAGEGAVAGVVATSVMTGWMRTARRCGLMREQPHHRIARVVLLPGSSEKPTSAERPVGGIAHLGFGATMGAAFGLLTGRHRPSAPAGAAYGVGVWAVSYQGWLPLSGIMPPAHRDRPGRAAAIFIAHIPYGVTLALTLRRMRRSPR